MGRASILGELEQMVVMAVMRLEAPYPVSVRNEIANVAGVQLSRGTIYVTLLRLERRGLVESWLGEPTPERGGKARRYFRVTPRGRRELADSRAALSRLAEGIEPTRGR